MQIVTLLIVALVYLSDDAARWWPWPIDLTLNERLLAALLGPAALIGLIVAAMRLCRRRMDRRGSWRAALLADRFMTAGMWLSLALHAFNIAALDLHGAIRTKLGDWVIVDEAIAMLPPLAILLGAWWAYYPIIRRLREASLIRHLDAGRTIYPIWTRREYMLSQARLHFGLVLLPAMLIMGWAEGIDFFWRHSVGEEVAPWWRHAALGLGVAAIFLFAPTFMTRIWDTQPLSEGELRDRLEQLCARHGVRVRRLLVWNTHGGMINGAVMGLLGRLRYVLLTDALLDAMTTRQVEAVMAHEIGHARRHHLPWLAICLLAILSTVTLLTTLAVRGVDAVANPRPSRVEVISARNARIEPAPRSRQSPLSPLDAGAKGDWLEPAGLVTTVLISLGVFGFTSRRFERQADTFAVQHLSGMTRDDGRERVITPEAAEAMSDALQVVAELNHIPITRRSWRHGSIRWRQDYLRTLIGRRCNDVPIDGQMRVLKALAAAALIASLALTWWIDGFG